MFTFQYSTMYTQTTCIYIHVHVSIIGLARQSRSSMWRVYHRIGVSPYKTPIRKRSRSSVWGVYNQIGVSPFSKRSLSSVSGYPMMKARRSLLQQLDNLYIVSLVFTLMYHALYTLLIDNSAFLRELTQKCKSSTQVSGQNVQGKFIRLLS